MFQNEDGTFQQSDTYMLGTNDDSQDVGLSPSLKAALIRKFGEETFYGQYPDEKPQVSTTGETEPTSPEGEEPVAPADPSPSAPTDTETLAPPATPGDLDPNIPGAAPTTDGFKITEDGSEPEPVAAIETPTSADDDLDLNDLWTRFNGGVKPQREQMVNLLQLIQQLGQLNPQQAHDLNLILQGQSPQFTQQPATPAPTPSSTPAATPPTSTPIDLDSLSPEARQVLAPILERQEALEAKLFAQEQAVEAQRLQQQQAQMQAGLAAGARDFVDSYKDVLSTTDMVLLETKVSQNAQFPFYLQQANGDAASAYRAMLEAAIWADDTMRNRVIAARQQQATTQTLKDEARKQKASSVSSTSSALNTLIPAPASGANGPLTRAEMMNAALADLQGKTGLSTGRYTPPS